MNRFKTLATMVLGVAVMIGAAALCPAQTGPLTQPPMTQPQPMPANGELTTDTLKTMLTNLGYEFTDEKLEKTSVIHVKVDHGGLTYQLNITLSTDHTKLWIYTQLATVPTGMEMPQPRLLKLLELNDKMGPSFFSYYPKLRNVYLSRPLDNRGVTPVLLRAEIMSLLNGCQQTQEDWDLRKWPEMKVAPSPSR